VIATTSSGRRFAALARYLMFGRSGEEPRVVWRMGSPLTVVGACWLAGLRLNVMGSLPVGLYVVTRAAPGRDAPVLVCLPVSVAEFAKARGHVPRGGACPGGLVPVGKRVWAIPGDSVTITPTGLLVNGTPVPNSRPLGWDQKGRPLPRLAVGRYVVHPGALWVVSSYSRFSFDSRYFGALETTRVRARVRPLWTNGASP
jgi:conjugative transfer signal peptidase TraF